MNIVLIVRINVFIYKTCMVKFDLTVFMIVSRNLIHIPPISKYYTNFRLRDKCVMLY